MRGTFHGAPVYGLGAEAPHAAKAVALAWPVWAAHVQVEQVGLRLGNELDLFEVGILDLAAAGVKSAKSMAADLDLDPELVAFVIASLQGRGLLDEIVRPTDSGSEVMKGQRGDERRYHTGYVLTDACSGRPWPGLHKRLESLEPHREPRSERRERLGTAPVTLRRTTLTPHRIPSRHAQPDLADAGFQARVRESVSESARAADLRGGTRAVRALDAPWPALVLTWAYRRLAGGDHGGWFIDRDLRILDPRGDGDAIELERELVELEAEHGGVAAVLAPLRHEDGDVAAVDQRQRLREEERRRLLLRLGSVPPAHPAVALLADALILRASGDVRHALVDLGAALETTLRHVAPGADYRRARARLPSGGEIEAVMEQALVVCGFAPVVPRGTINALATSGGAMLSLRALAALTVLMAADDRTHPLREVALAESESEPSVSGLPEPVRWLADVDDLVTHRNPSAHGIAPGSQVEPLASESQLDRWFRLVERATGHLLRSSS